MIDQATPQTASLNTMLQTIETGTEILQRVMPEVAVVGGFVPGATPFIQIVGMALGPVQNAIKFIMQESGKDPMAAFEDFLMHIGPNNGYVSPSLSKPVPDSALAPIATGTGD